MIKKAAFADAQNFIAECYDRSYVLCETASSIMINAYMAEDRYYEALELMKIKDEMKMKFKQTSAHKGFSAGSYKDMTRVAKLNPTMWTQLFLENKDNLIFEIDHLQDELAKYRQALVDEDFDGLKELLDEGRKIKEEVDGI